MEALMKAEKNKGHKLEMYLWIFFFRSFALTRKNSSSIGKLSFSANDQKKKKKTGREEEGRDEEWKKKKRKLLYFSVGVVVVDL